MKTSEIGIFSREESDFDHPGAPKWDPPKTPGSWGPLGGPAAIAEWRLLEIAAIIRFRSKDMSYLNTKISVILSSVAPRNPSLEKTSSAASRIFASLVIWIRVFCLRYVLSLAIGSLEERPGATRIGSLILLDIDLS